MYDLMRDFVLSDDQIALHAREMGFQRVSAVRQDQLRNIMLGALAGMRAATADELAEVEMVQADMEVGAAWASQARADMALLRGTLSYEQAMARLAQPDYSGPETLADEAGDEVPYPDYVRDQTEIAQASAVVDAATAEVVALSITRANHRAVDANTQEV